jgi:peptide/nickel transport system substrate-binding protein
MQHWGWRIWIWGLLMGLVGLTPVYGAEVKGPIVDYMYINVKMQAEIGLKDVAEGLTDVFFYGVGGPVVAGLDQATRDKLDLYTVPSGTWSLAFNPIPNAAPYLVEADGREVFNPFAIRDVRFAMNFLINRKYIVDEILFGAGGPALTMATPGQPGTYKYNLLASRLGLTAEGDEQRALTEIAAALEAAAALPELQGRLVKEGDWWMFDNAPVTVKFLIRVDDPQGRLKEGEYVAQQIEKAGIRVERLLWDRAKCGKAVYGSDPAAYEWTLYTEGWSAGATRAFWEHIVAQMYAPWYGYMPGGANPDFWNYQHAELDEVTKKAFTGNFVTEDEYWEYALRGLELGLQEAVRIYVAYQNQYFAANKARFEQKMVYGLADGLNNWSLLTADTPDNVLYVTGYSAKGSLFMHAWDPIGPDGFSDFYSMVCAEPTGLAAMFESPATAEYTPLLVTPQDAETQVRRDDEGNVVGDLAVPAEARRYDSARDAWTPVGDGVTAMSRAFLL